MSRMFGRIFWYSSGIITGIYIDQTKVWVPRVDTIVNKLKNKYGDDIKQQTSEVAGVVLEVIDEIKNNDNKK